MYKERLAGSAVFASLKSKYLNRKIVFTSDLFFSVFSSVLALIVCHFFLSLEIIKTVIPVIFLFSFCISGVCFLICRIHKGAIRYSAFIDTGRIAIASILKVIAMCWAVYLFLHDFSLRQILLIAIFDLFLTFFTLTIFRLLLILIYSMLIGTATSRQGKLLIYINDIGGTLKGEGNIQEDWMYPMGGFITFDTGTTLRVGKHMIYSVTDQNDFACLVKRRNIKAILFPSREAVRKEKGRLVRFCEMKKIQMLVVPSFDELKVGKLKLHNLPEVNIEDLLGRDEVAVDMAEIGKSLSGKSVLVTGAAGSIGSELCRILCSFEIKQLLLFDSAETPMYHLCLELKEKYPDVSFIPVMGDIRVRKRLEEVFRLYSPQIVFHAAAYKHVPLMEENPCEAVRTNVFGTRNVADVAVRNNVDKFIMISTDKAVNPSNVMGASKRLAEIYIQGLSIAIGHRLHPGKTRFITTRFGNVLGSNGSVIPRFCKQLLKGGPLTVTHPEIVRYFMSIPEACRLVLEAAVMGEGNEIYVFDMGDPVKIADLAHRMITLSGLVPGVDIQIRYTGLRPGEKLYEELLADKENVTLTKNKKIFRGKVREYDFYDILEQFKELEHIASGFNKRETVRLMKTIIPEFKSENSEYEELDRSVGHLH